MHTKEEEELQQDSRPNQPAELEGRKELCLTLLSRGRAEEGKSLKLTK